MVRLNGCADEQAGEREDREAEAAGEVWIHESLPPHVSFCKSVHKVRGVECLHPNNNPSPTHPETSRTLPVSSG